MRGASPVPSSVPIQPPRKARPSKPKPAGFGHLKDLGGALFGGGLVSGVAAVFATIAAFIGQQQAHDAQISATKAQGELTQSRLEFDRDRGVRGDQLTIYQRVEANLKDGEPSGVIISAAYATLVEDTKTRLVLCDMIKSVADQKLREVDPEKDLKKKTSIEGALGSAAQLMKECDPVYQPPQPVAASAPEEIGPQADASQTLPSVIGGIFKPSAYAPARPPAVAAPATQVAAATAATAEVVSKAAYSPNGWDVDVFWCEAKGPPAQMLAAAISDDLAKASDAKVRIGQETLGRIRLRALTPAVAARLGASGTIVRVDANETAFGAALAGYVNALPLEPKPAFTAVRGVSNTRWYVSIFAC